MSYQALARKWRPRFFKTLVGQEHVVRALTHALEHNRLHHAYLFAGTRGVGKTTIARILAKSLNCERGVSADPCGVCGTCVEIDRGGFIDLIEVDAATNTRVDEMRLLLENSTYVPTRGRYKIYVIDEVHMLSNSAFNAMLKTLEEPPEHVKFILATTDPQKIPVTVLSRCLQFNLKQMSQEGISTHLMEILRQEAIDFEGDALRSIARAANGSMRDALSILDQAISFGSGQVTSNSVSAMLGSIEKFQLLEIIGALADETPERLRSITRDLATRGLSFEGTLTALSELWVEIQAVQLGCSPNYRDDEESLGLYQFAEQLTAEYLQLAYMITNQGRAELNLAPNHESGFLMTLLRLDAFCPKVSNVKKKNAPIDSLLSKYPKGKKAGIELNAVRPDGDRPESAVFLPKTSDQLDYRVGDSKKWDDIFLSLELTGITREMASHCELVELSSRQIVLRISNNFAHLVTKKAHGKLAESILDRLNIPQVVIEQGETFAETPAQIWLRADAEKKEAAMRWVERDSFVIDVANLMDASVVDSSVQVLSI